MSWVRSGATPLSDLLPSENDVMSYGLKIADLGIFFLFLKKNSDFFVSCFFFFFEPTARSGGKNGFGN